MTTTQIIAKQGWLGAFIFLILFLLAMWFDYSVWAFILFILLIVWLVMFRNPERIPNIDESNAFVSPVDGIVRDISSNEEQISLLIQTSFLDVGMIRAPHDILKGEYTERKGLSLTYCNRDKRNQLNAFMEFRSIQNRVFFLEFYPVFFSSHYLFAPKSVNMGERIGFMKVGMTRIVIPQKREGIRNHDLELKVNIGDRVKALQSIIGYFHEI